MNEEEVSPKYLMELIPKVDAALWAMFSNSKYQNVRRYIERWHNGEWGGWNNNDWIENFEIFYRDDAKKEIDLLETLHRMPADIVIKIAIDLGIDTPGFLPLMPKFRNVLKDQNQSAYQNFVRASKTVTTDPDNAVALAASTLEGIIKTILEHKSFAEYDVVVKNKPLSKLVTEILKKFKLDDDDTPQEIFTLAKQLRGVGGTIDDLRSDKSTAHGKGSTDYVVNDPLWATMTVNAVTTVGLFLWEYFNKKYVPRFDKKPTSSSTVVVMDDIDDKPVDLSEIPF